MGTTTKSMATSASRVFEHAACLQAYMASWPYARGLPRTGLHSVRAFGVAPGRGLVRASSVALGGARRAARCELVLLSVAASSCHCSAMWPRPKTSAKTKRAARIANDPLRIWLRGQDLNL